MRDCDTFIVQGASPRHQILLAFGVHFKAYDKGLQFTARACSYVWQRLPSWPVTDLFRHTELPSPCIGLRTAKCSAKHSGETHERLIITMKKANGRYTYTEGITCIVHVIYVISVI